MSRVTSTLCHLSLIYRVTCHQGTSTCPANTRTRMCHLCLQHVRLPHRHIAGCQNDRYTGDRHCVVSQWSTEWVQHLVPYQCHRPRTPPSRTGIWLVRLSLSFHLIGWQVVIFILSTGLIKPDFLFVSARFLGQQHRIFHRQHRCWCDYGCARQLLAHSDNST